MKIRNIVATLSLVATSGVLAATKPAETPLDVSWSLETGIGYETNAYHAPDHDYADYYADPTGATIVSPDEKGGFFIPLKFDTEITTPLSKYIKLLGSYRFDGNFHPDSALQDANDTKHQLGLGTEFKLGKKGKDGKAYAGVFTHAQNKVYVDRDSGEPKASTGSVDVSNRYTYTSYGVEGEYERKVTTEDNVGLKLTMEDLNYSDPIAWSQYDHIYTMYGIYWEHYYPTNTKLTLETSKEVRDYSERHAYNIDGSLFATNPTLNYTYSNYSVGVRQKIDDKTVSYFDYELTQRRDNHVGYNDLDRMSYKVRVYYDLNEKMRLKARIAYYNYQYANAYNFEDPAQGSKKRSSTDIQLRGDYQWNKNKTYYVELESRRHNNTDDRYQYNNNAVMLGAKWKY